MRSLNQNEINYVHGGTELTNAEATNAYMMAGSMFFPIIGVAIFKSSFPAAVGAPLITTLSCAFAEAVITAAGTGLGVWVGYQVYYAVYDE